MGFSIFKIQSEKEEEEEEEEQDVVNGENWIEKWDRGKENKVWVDELEVGVEIESAAGYVKTEDGKREKYRKIDTWRESSLVKERKGKERKKEREKQKKE